MVNAGWPALLLASRALIGADFVCIDLGQFRLAKEFGQRANVQLVFMKGFRGDVGRTRGEPYFGSFGKKRLLEFCRIDVPRWGVNSHQRTAFPLAAVPRAPKNRSPSTIAKPSRRTQANRVPRL